MELKKYIYQILVKLLREKRQEHLLRRTMMEIYLS